MNKVGSFFDANGFAAMHHYGDKRDLVKVCFVLKDDTAAAAWREGWQLLRPSGAMFAGSSEANLDVPYIGCHEECEHVARLSTVLVLLKDFNGMSDRVMV